jgi:hypothetical protein
LNLTLDLSLVMDCPQTSLSVIRYITTGNLAKDEEAAEEIVIWTRMESVVGSTKTPLDYINDFIALYTNVITH